MNLVSEIVDWVFDQFIYPIWEAIFPPQDASLSRIMYDPGRQAAPQIAWPEGLAPSGPAAPENASAIPESDVLVITWTEAEARALADVLTPGIQSTEWVYYKTNYAAYVPQLTGRSPAKASGRLGSWATVKIGPVKVVVLKSELHPATDGPSLPTAQLIEQIAREAGVRYIITTGTAGGAGNGTRLGDVNVSLWIHADFTRELKGQPFSQQEWPSAALAGQQRQFIDMVPNLAPTPGYPIGSGALEGAAKPQLWYGDVVSTDFFAFDTTDDHYGLRAYDPLIRAVEMDDAAVAVAAAAIKVPVISARNASDPVMPDASKASAAQADKIYQRYGYYTTINSALVAWALIAGLPPKGE
jgi:nucleoside phosphorylase